MQKALVREGVYFLVLLFVLALLIHPDLLSSPMERIDAAIESGNYFHPLLYTGVLFSIFFILRFIVKKIVSFFKRTPKE
ncbi:MAG: hypothetical protein GXO11_03105 [Epsilonproteobacteria bacterium]|nr:hypothetical protein [Campylobacterota bacterium]